MGIYTCFYKGFELFHIEDESSEEDIQKIETWVKEKRDQKNFPWFFKKNGRTCTIEYDSNYKGDIDYFLKKLKDFLIECSKYNMGVNEAVPYSVETEAGAVFINSFDKEVEIKLRGFNDGDIVDRTI